MEPSLVVPSPSKASLGQEEPPSSLLLPGPEKERGLYRTTKVLTFQGTT